jgi:hypothetical protein
MAALWAKPEACLDARVRRATSAWHQIPNQVVDRALAALGRDLDSGRWDERYGHLRHTATRDIGLRIVRADLTVPTTPDSRRFAAWLSRGAGARCGAPSGIRSRIARRDTSATEPVVGLRIGVPTGAAPTFSEMPEIESRVDAEKIRLLLSEGHESAQLDYKAGCNIRERREVVAITKDIGAMNVLGGYIVVGADDRGQPTGKVSPQDVQAFDQANLQGKLRRYLPESVEVRTAAHQIDGEMVIVVYVAPHPDGFVVFDADGAYPGNDGRDRFEFRFR